MKLTNKLTAIIIPLKENYTFTNFGAVSVWVSEYLKFSKTNNLVFCKKKKLSDKYLSNNILPIDEKSKYFTNINYIKKINEFLINKKITNVEIHNRPEYAIYLIEKNPEIKINLIFHNDPNKIRSSVNIENKKILLEKCNRIQFVSKWVKKKFFENLDNSHKNNTDIIYNFINPIKKFPKKKKLIIFSGKLNKSKGYEIFAKTISKVLNKYPQWKAVVYGNESRENINIKHKRLEINNWITHKKLLNVYAKSSISIVNPTWEEPFGRTAMESASRGCAVITSKSGGMSETFNNNLVLTKNNPKKLYLKICELISNPKFLKKIQIENFRNVIHKPDISLKKLDAFRINKKIINQYINNRYFKILHIGNFGSKVDHRLFNISLSKKISNGLIRNGHDVIDFDYRNNYSKFFEKFDIDKKILDISRNYKPDLILLGHNNVLNRNTLLELKEKINSKVSIWYEDHVIKGDPNYRNNLNLLEKNSDLIDHYFITTSPDIIKSKIKAKKLHFLPIPVDPNIENGFFYDYPKSKDLFFGISHGVNFGKLKKSNNDERLRFVNKLINISDNKFNFNFLGLFDEQPKWNYKLNDEIKICKTALNLSRGGPSKYASSNRIATLMGNGILTFIDEKICYQDFFQDDEIITYKNHNDLLNKLSTITNNEKRLIKKSELAKKNYFRFFDNKIVTDYIIYKTFNVKNKFKYIWDK
tara:strand:+ start:446 stop:2548 length:2103 start_codon:yes stop_codon:yes gene_type:complete